MMRFFSAKQFLDDQRAAEEREGELPADASGPAQAYEAQINSIRSLLTDSLRAFLDGGTLHDGDVIGYKSGNGTATLWVRQDRGYDADDV